MAATPSQPYRIALAGLGTVGSGLVELLAQERTNIARKIGRDITLVAVSARDQHKNRTVDINPYPFFSDAITMAREADYDALVELIGGSQGAAPALWQAAIDRDKTIITANKALLAERAADFLPIIEQKKITLLFEAAVAGGIPIIAIMKESLMAVTIDGLYGIVNGTCNYILTEMAAQKANFKDMLLLAQKKGYAEADPTFDIDGTDSFHKLVILTMLAFGITPPTSGSGHRGAAHGGVAVEGITKIEWVDIFYAKMFGFVIKLLAYGRQTNEHLSLGVAPMLVPDNHSIAHVDGALNAIDITSPAHGSLLFVGKGAGGPPTAAAVLSDMMKAASSHPNHQATGYQPPFIRPFQQLQQNQLSLTNPDEEYGRFYLRLTVDDKIGVLASAGGILRDEDISIEKLHQHDDKPVHIVFITHPTKAAAIKKAVAKIKKLEAVLDEPCLIRLMGHR